MQLRHLSVRFVPSRGGGAPAPRAPAQSRSPPRRRRSPPGGRAAPHRDELAGRLRDPSPLADFSEEPRVPLSAALSLFLFCLCGGLGGSSTSFSSRNIGRASSRPPPVSGGGGFVEGAHEHQAVAPAGEPPALGAPPLHELDQAALSQGREMPLYRPHGDSEGLRATVSIRGQHTPSSLEA